MLIAIAGIAVFAAGYLVGSNNPLPSVKAKIIAKAQDTVKKL